MIEHTTLKQGFCLSEENVSQVLDLSVFLLRFGKAAQDIARGRFPPSTARLALGSGSFRIGKDFAWTST